MTPTLEGRVLQALEPDSAASVLEIGTGTGFLAACFARLANRVTSVDIHQDFLKTAAVNLEDSGINNVELLEMDATRQLPDGTVRCHSGYGLDTEIRSAIRFGTEARRTAVRCRRRSAGYGGTVDSAYQ